MKDKNKMMAFVGSAIVVTLTMISIKSVMWVFNKAVITVLQM